MNDQTRQEVLRRMEFQRSQIDASSVVPGREGNDRSRLTGIEGGLSEFL